MKPFYLTLLFIVAAASANGQRNGLLLDDEAYETVPLTEPLSNEERGKLPEAVDLMPYCPTPGDQGDLPSCVAWALANAMTVQKALKQRTKRPEQIDAFKFSVSYIYNQIKHKGLCDLGASFSAGLMLVKNKGNCPASMLPYSLDCNPNPSQQHHQQAAPNRIADYRRVFSESASVDDKIDHILGELAALKPVLIGLKVPYDFRENIPAPRTSWRAEDPHAMLVVGYNEYSETFLIMNSYGSGWGDGGFFRMDWDTLGEQVRYGYALLP